MKQSIRLCLGDDGAKAMESRKNLAKIPNVLIVDEVSKVIRYGEAVIDFPNVVLAEFD